MATHIRLDGVPTGYDGHGQGEPLVLLHPGGADARAFAPNLDALAATSASSPRTGAATATAPTSTAPSPTSRWPRTPSPSWRRSWLDRPTWPAAATGCRSR